MAPMMEYEKIFDCSDISEPTATEQDTPTTSLYHSGCSELYNECSNKEGLCMYSALKREEDEAGVSKREKG